MLFLSIGILCWKISSVKGVMMSSSQSDLQSKKILGHGLTFDDVLLRPRHSKIVPREAILETQITKGIKLNIPLLSAAMDTVTESRLAIALSREGGLGVIHKNLSIQDQAAQVAKVKRSEGFTIKDPITLPPDVPLSEAIAVMNKYIISGFPVVSGSKLVGMLTHRDMRFVDDVNQPISNFMTSKNLITVSTGTTLEEAWELFRIHRVEKLPVVDKDNTLTGLITAKDIRKKSLYPNASKDSKGRLIVGAAVGITVDTMDRVTALIEADVDLIIVDTAHGHSEGVLNTIKQIKKSYPDTQVIGGNVATGEGTEDVIKAGADGVKVGIGAGAICTTRVIAGIGVPQVSAIMDCYQAAGKYDIPIVADGGIRYSGDISKSIAAGASAVMIGSLFAGTEEAPGERVLLEGRTYKVYYGMGSLAAMKRGSSDRYFQEGASHDKLVPEGIEGRVPFRGKLSDTVHQLTGGIRASMGYCGCRDISAFQKDTVFTRVTAAGVREGHPHDVVISQEAPNYQVSN